MKCPVSIKINNIEKIMRIDENELKAKRASQISGHTGGKKILREAVAMYIPKDLANAGKQGFSSPDASWFKGESIDFVRRVLSNKEAHLYEFLDYDTVMSLINEHLNGKKEYKAAYMVSTIYGNLVGAFEV